MTGASCLPAEWGRDIIGLLVRDLNLASEYYSQAICWREKRYQSCIQLIKSYVFLAFEGYMAKGGLATLYQVLTQTDAWVCKEL